LVFVRKAASGIGKITFLAKRKFEPTQAPIQSQ